MRKRILGGSIGSWVKEQPETSSRLSFGQSKQKRKECKFLDDPKLVLDEARRCEGSVARTRRQRRGDKEARNRRAPPQTEMTEQSQDNCKARKPLIRRKRKKMLRGNSYFGCRRKLGSEARSSQESWQEARGARDGASREIVPVVWFGCKFEASGLRGGLVSRQLLPARKCHSTKHKYLRGWRWVAFSI